MEEEIKPGVYAFRELCKKLNLPLTGIEKNVQGILELLRIYYDFEYYEGRPTRIQIFKVRQPFPVKRLEEGRLTAGMYKFTELRSTWARGRGADMKKDEWLEHYLAPCAEYEEVEGTPYIMITKVVDEYLEDPEREEIFKRYEYSFGTEEAMVDSYENCWRKLNQRVKNGLSNEKNILFIKRAKEIDYGKPYVNEGKLGKSRYLLGKVGMGDFSQLDHDEIELRNELLSKWFNWNQLILIIKSAKYGLKNGDLNQKEYEKVVIDLFENDNWDLFLKEFEGKIGEKVDFRQELIPN